MKFERSSGILLHITSLSGKYGIGSLGKEAHEFVDFLKKSEQKLWQIFPLGPTGFGDSPYQTFSAFAGNPLLIDLDLLIDEKLLEQSNLDNLSAFSETEIDFGELITVKDRILRKAFDNFEVSENYNEFHDEEQDWLNDFALFMSLKKHFQGASWSHWDRDIKLRELQAIEYYNEELKDEINYHKFLQFIFFQQWEKLHDYARKNNIKIIGDIPIFIGFDSADAWVNSDIFYFDENREPTKVAGVPPDGFSETGQLWGNPLYDWEAMEKDGFKWWIKRFEAALKQVDILRIDHFIGFVNYWAVPFGDKTAENGKWETAEGDKLFQQVQNKLGSLPIIAEDLGVLTPEIIKLRDQYGFPGMKVLQFAFYDGMEGGFLPHNFTENFVVYTGTHDNETTKGWFSNLPENVRDFTCSYLNFSGNESEIADKLIEAAWKSIAVFAIAPMQDFLNLDNSARMNYPGIAGGNWQWRMKKQYLTDELADKICRITEKFGRN
ncbi:MAG: 4-alpha-glucanotransferase [Candidatus Cloacimonetes bacterium]|nr:4-alpha-glucanotransferase [Candidatus Cloacimonadota bacterium]